jgi:predicted ester cyclase
MNANESERRIRGLIERIWNNGELDAVAMLCRPDVVLRLPQGLRLSGVAAYQDYVASVREEYPNLHVRIQELALLGDQLALRYTWSGSFVGGMTPLGPAPAGSKVIVEGVGLYHLLNGRVLVGTCSEDWLGMYQQLGLVAGGAAEAQAVWRSGQRVRARCPLPARLEENADDHHLCR